MQISFRTKIFDTTSSIAEGAFYGEDFAKWLQARLAGRQSEIVAEDWGWTVVSRKGDFRCILGIYDHDTNDITDLGPKWIIRIFSGRDWRGGLKGWLKRAPSAVKEAAAEVAGILETEKNIKDIKIE